MEKKVPKSAQKRATFYRCSCCDYTCCRSSDWVRHLATGKHATQSHGNEMEMNGNAGVAKAHICKICQKEYRNASGLWKHNRKCGAPLPSNTAEPAATTAVPMAVAQPAVTSDLMQFCDSVMKSNQSFQESILQVLMQHISSNAITVLPATAAQPAAANSNNTTFHNSTVTQTNSTTHNNSMVTGNNFNLNFFLNETCKNAMNITDFADSIQVELSDLERVGEEGYVKGISHIILQHLQALDVTERPIHCTDQKRETLYVKHQDKWEKEESDRKHLNKVIKKVANKNYSMISQFRELHPDCNKSYSTYSDKYNRLIFEASSGVSDHGAEYDTKIIRNIARFSVVNKEPPLLAS